MSPTGQAMASRTPSVVATPLPPLKSSHTGATWPTTTQPAAITAMSGPKRWAMTTATAPLPPSSSSVSAAAALLPVRSTLVAPMLPEPMRRRSPRRKRRATIMRAAPIR